MFYVKMQLLQLHRKYILEMLPKISVFTKLCQDFSIRTECAACDMLLPVFKKKNLRIISAQKIVDVVDGNMLVED